ncbi:hypothetical protein ABT354_33170 [Streptomyces sp. NPDC000594]|uniref:hypothetical protein n=1 Tax=Streptomyces sp. NPDC000594 TaxID=3154261 RepID=UPI00331E0DD9
MSTPPIARDDSGDGRSGPLGRWLRGPRRERSGDPGRARRERDRSGGRGPRRDRPRAGAPFPDGTLPRPSPVESAAVRESGEHRLVQRARKHGQEAAGKGVYDPWVLAGADQVPYFAGLAHQRERVRDRLAVAAALAEDDAALEASRLRAAVTAADERLTRAEERRARLLERLAVVIAQLDRLARRADRWHAFRDTLMDRYERRRRRAGLPPEGSPPEPSRGGSPRWQAVPETGRGAQDRAGGRTAPSAATRAAWEGATARPGMSRTGRIGLLALLALVEIPVYYVVFRRLHDGDAPDVARTLSVSLTLAVATVMILAPHFAGRVLRGRGATGAIKFSALPALGIMVAWGYGAWMLGRMRAALIFADPPPVIINGKEYPGSSTIDSLELSEGSVSVMFIALLLLSGGIAFLVGLADEHPYLASYRHLVERLRALERTMAADRLGAERAREALVSLEARNAERRAARDARRNAVGSLYESAAAAYLDGVTLAGGDPAITEAAARLARVWPLLPEAPERTVPVSPQEGSGADTEEATAVRG